MHLFAVSRSGSGGFDLKPGRFAAMVVIQNNPGINQTALGRAIARDKSTITPLLQGLERQGLVRGGPRRTMGAVSFCP